MRSLFRIFVLLLLIPVLGRAQSPLDTLSLESIFYEPLLPGNRPDFTFFSPDLSAIYYQANDSSMTEEKLYLRSLNGGDAKRASEDVKFKFRLSPDGEKLLYHDRGDIWTADLDFQNRKQLIDTEATEFDATWGPNSNRIAFIQEGNVWILDINSAGLIQVTDKEEEETGFNIAGWAGNNKLVLSQFDTSDFREYYFPEYIGQYVETGTTRRGIARQVISVAYLQG